MRRSIGRLILGAFALSAPLLVTSVALAEKGPAACGNIEVSASAKCTVEVEGGCTAHCEPISFEAQCSANLEVSCSGECSASATVDCTGSCEADCNGSCDPGSLDCEGSCSADCSGSCEGHCSAADNHGECVASCRSTCSAECSASCSANPPTCEGSCKAQCEGSCKAEANIDCQVSCQSSGYAECKANLQGGCEAQCSKPDGALFCDGQYVDTGDNLAECTAWLKAALNIEASASAECSGNSCEAEAACSCGPSSIANAPVSETTTIAAFAAGLGFLVSRRRRRSK